MHMKMVDPNELSDVVSRAVSAIQQRPQTSRQAQNNDNDISRIETDAQQIQDDHNWRNILSFWILGLCNNYGFVVMLSAAYDIIQRFDSISNGYFPDPLAPSTDRDCHVISTGVLLLADTIPSLLVKLIAPFLPMYINLRMVLTCVFSAAGFIIVAAAQYESQAIIGVVFTSFSSGLGETSMLAYTPKFSRNVIPAWSSGTGAAGVAGALTYSALILLRFSPKSTLLLMLIVPLLQLITFCFIVQEPNRPWTTLSGMSSTTSLIEHANYERGVTYAEPPLSFAHKLRYFPKLLKYILPLFIVYLCEYLINQGLFDLIFFQNIWLDHSQQYQYLQITYQIGVFVSRSSLTFFTTNALWMMALLQFVNVIYFTFQAIFMTVPTIWIIFVIVFWEGLLGGCTYANTINRLALELPPPYKSFGLGVTIVGQTIGVVLAGLLAIPIHNLICQMPAPVVLD